MKRIAEKSPTSKRNNDLFDDENVRYKLNKNFLTTVKPNVSSEESDDDVRYMLAENNIKSKQIKPKNSSDNSDGETKYKLNNKKAINNKKNHKQPNNKKKKKNPKDQFKVKFWSNKKLKKSQHDRDKKKKDDVIKNIVQSSNIRKNPTVSILPCPLFSENHIPMVTVPDDLTLNFTEEDDIDMNEEMRVALINNKIANKNIFTSPKKSDKGIKRKHSSDCRANDNYDSALEYFSKSVVLKLRRMDTNQRIFAENLVHTVLMLGELGELNRNTNITES